jgi:hypothetical protein
MGIDFRRNAKVLTAIHTLSRPQAQPTRESPYVAEGYELRAAPELVDRLQTLARYVPGSSFAYVQGVPVLHTASGRIFAIAGGKYHLSLFLPDEKGWGEPNDDYQIPWRTGIAWPVNPQSDAHADRTFQQLMNAAYQSAMEADRGA